MVFKDLHEWRLLHFPGKLVPGLDNHCNEEIVLDVNLNIPWHNLRLFPLVLALVT